MDYVNGTEYETESGFVPRINEYNIFVVWISKVLQNNKALLSTTTDGDTRYYEITYNGDADEFYFDAYDMLRQVSVFQIGSGKNARLFNVSGIKSNEQNDPLQLLSGRCNSFSSAFNTILLTL
jgi:hypothetical protein